MLPSTPNRSASLALLFAASLLGASGSALADGNPQSSASTASPAVDPPANVGAPISLSRQGGTSSNEPTFQTETRVRTWPNTPLLATGATIFGLSYLPAVVGGALSDADQRKDLYIPVAGPWMMLAGADGLGGGDKTLLIADGAAQGLGALMLVASLFIPKRTTRHWYLIGSTDTMIAPTRVSTGYGMGARGRF